MKATVSVSQLPVVCSVGSTNFYIKKTLFSSASEWQPQADVGVIIPTYKRKGGIDMERDGDGERYG